MDQYVEALERRVAQLEADLLGLSTCQAAAAQDFKRRLADLEKAVLTLTGVVEKHVGKPPVPAKKTIRTPHPLPTGERVRGAGGLGLECSL